MKLLVLFLYLLASSPIPTGNKGSRFAPTKYQVRTAPDLGPDLDLHQRKLQVSALFHKLSRYGRSLPKGKAYATPQLLAITPPSQSALHLFYVPHRPPIHLCCLDMDDVQVARKLAGAQPEEEIDIKYSSSLVSVCAPDWVLPSIT